MSNLDTILKKFNVELLEQIDKYVDNGKKVIGCSPVYAPEELVYASGMVPIGVWGAEGEVISAKEYFPAFYASLILRTLDLGIDGKLDKLSAMIIPGLSDGLKGLSQNWKRSVKNVPSLYLAFAQNRKIKAGLDFNEKQYLKLKKQLEAISGKEIDNESIENAIKLYNNHRKAMKQFSKLVATHLNTIKASDRALVMSSAYLMDKAEHLELLNELNEMLSNLPEEKFAGKKVVTTGIIANSPGILKILDENNLGVVDDNINHESGQFETLIDEDTENPLRALAKWISDVEGNTFLYDPEKLRGKILTDKVKKYSADGVIYILTKFCDSDEFDYPIIRDELDSNGIMNILVEVDQQMTKYEQSNTALQTFAEMI